MQHETNGDGDGYRQYRQVDEVLPLIGDRPLRQDFLQLACGHQAAGNGETAEDDLQREHRHHERRNIRGPQVELRGSHQGYAKCSEGVTQRSSLRDRGHSDIAQRDANHRAQDQCNGDPLIVHDAVIQKRAGDCQHHSHFTCPNSPPRGDWRTQPLQRQDEEDGSDDVGDLNDVFGRWSHGFCVRLDLNILSMRSVIMKPPTALLVAATIAIVPSTVASVDLCSPARMMAPTTAIASNALVSDINGVCSNGDTRRITSNPIKAASMKTYRLLNRSAVTISFPPSIERPGQAVNRTPALVGSPLRLPG